MIYFCCCVALVLFYIQVVFLIISLILQYGVKSISVVRKDDLITKLITQGFRIEGGAAPALVVLEMGIHLFKWFRIEPLNLTLFVLLLNIPILIIETVDVKA